jgi:signal transduction histidine kinase
LIDLRNEVSRRGGAVDRKLRGRRIGALDSAPAREDDLSMEFGASASARRAAALSAGAFVGGAGLAATALGLATGHDRIGVVGFAVGHVALVVVGVVIVVRSEFRRVGWLLVAIAAAGSLHVLANHVAVAMLEHDGADVGVRVMSGIQGASFAPVLVGSVLLCLTFPDGRLVSRRWRPVAWATIALGAMALIGGMLDAFRSDDVLAMLKDRSLQRADDPSSDATDTFFAVVSSLLLVAGAAALMSRWRRSERDERARIQWVMFAAVAFALHWPLAEIADTELMYQVAPGVVATLVASAFAAAIFRYRLFDIDVAMRRSVVYGVLWTAIAGFYLGLAAVLGIAAGTRLPVGVAIAVTLAATIVFEPARRRLEAVADRVAFGRRSDPTAVIGQLGDVITVATDVGEISRHLASAAMTATRAASVTVALDGAPVVRLGRPTGEGELAVAIQHADETLGEIRVQPRDGVWLDETARSVLPVLASLAAIGVEHVQLAARIAHAASQERRRVERDLHDGAQQELVALIARLGLARVNANGDRGLLAEIELDVQRILSDLRDLARGIHPAVLTDGGLAEAVHDLTDRLPLPVTIEAPRPIATARFDPDTEVAAYFFVAEALNNVIKHAAATHATVRLEHRGTSLIAIVVDDGCGFDPDRAPRHGLNGITDRVAAEGGRVTITSSPGTGTTLTAIVPASIVARS